MKYYYTVLVASAQYHGAEALTYSSTAEIVPRSVVLVPLQKQVVLGVVLARTKHLAFKTKDILEVYDLPPLPAAVLSLADWIKLYYPAPLGMVTQLLLPGTLTDKTIMETAGLTSSIPVNTASLPAVTSEQKAVLGRIAAADTYLLHGDTGTGKTRIYIELALRAVSAGKSAIVLTPEIGLTSQLFQSFQRVFGDRVVLVHSQLTPKARQQTWLRILRSSEPIIVLGPRSALFAPLRDIGLIAVDESHEPAYKQEQAPHYQAVRVASQLAHLHKASLILGSATPSVTDYYIAEHKHKPILRMRQIATPTLGETSASRVRSTGGRLTLGKGPSRGTSNPLDSEVSPRPVVQTTLVDLKDHSQFTRSQYLSNALITAVETSLAKGEQSLLYLNRRGTARVILCSNCGWQAVCPHCDLPLTYHQDLHLLQCHSCGYHQTAPTTCPECGNTDIVFKVVGTKAIETEVARLFPGAHAMRFDTDNKASERFEKHYNDVRAGKIDILIGTQLLAKGLDLPKLSTLGVVIADTSLTFPDYSAEERTYQLLTQVIGRVGRGHLHDEQIVVQSYDPTRPVIAAALAGDWDSFYQTELAERRLFDFPPFCYLLKLGCRRASSKATEKAVEQFSSSISRLGLPLLIEGPMPSFHARQGDKYEWQLIIKSRQRAALLEVIKLLKTDAKSGWSYDIDPVNLL